MSEGFVETLKVSTDAMESDNKGEIYGHNLMGWT